MKPICLLILLALISTTCLAQRKAKPASVSKVPLTHDVYDGWKIIPASALSTDGRFALYTINPREGDGKLFIHDFSNNRKDSVDRAVDFTISYDSRFAAFKIYAPKEVVKDLRRKKTKKEELPKDSLGIYDLVNRKVIRIADVRSYKIPEKTGGWIAYLHEPRKEPKKGPAESGKTGGARQKKIRKNDDDNGYTLVVRTLQDTTRTLFGYVKDYVFPKYGKGLLFSTTGNDSTVKPGVYWFDLSTRSLLQLHAGLRKYKYTGLGVSEDGTQACFLVDTDTTKAQVRRPKLYYWRAGNTTADLLADERSAGMPGEWLVSSNYAPNFSKDGQHLYMGIAALPVVRDTMKLDEEIPKVEVWGWRDSVLYPQQNKQVEKESKRSYLAVINLPDKTIVPLASKGVEDIYLTDNGNANIALAVSDHRYRWSRFYDVNVDIDAYAIDLRTGNRTLAASQLKAHASISPKANYLFWFNLADTAWYSYDVSNKQTTRLSTTGILFADEQNDVPGPPEPYGTAGWTEGDEALWVYDRYDIWSFDPHNRRPPQNLTRIGREQRLTFRYVVLDPEERFIKKDGDVLLSAFNEITNASGYYRFTPATGKLQKLLMSDHKYAGVAKAKNADRLLFTRETFREFPDLWTTNTSFSATKKITDANPQARNFFWGSVEHVSWTSSDGIPLRGLLYKPENFDATKKYPMMVYFYERSSDLLNNHFAPAPSASVISRTYFSSNGYLVFVPDIVYKTGFPGESAYNCVIPGVMSLISKGFVDEANIGVQGQSWGGYQTAYLVTRTNLFKAAGTGAPVVNMTSAYGGIRWETGLSRMFQYERTQSRIGGTLWQKPLYYIENSPLFFADKIETPVLIMHNDADGSVPWYQGIEFYMALRRMNKPVWLLVYNNEDHNLKQWQNKKDLSVRLSQFFDHYLKNGPMPPWMDKGVPAVEKGITDGY